MRAPAHWTLSGAPIVDVGTKSGPSATRFYRIGGVARLSDGNVVVANGGTDQLRYFGPAGRFIGQVGGRGGGPGQFPGIIFWLFRRGDTLIAVDNTGRANIFSPQGKYLKTSSYAFVPGVTGLRRTGTLSDGSVVLYGDVVNTAGRTDPTWYQVIKERPNSTPDRLFRLRARPASTTVNGRSVRPWYEPVGEIVARSGRICAGYPADYVITCYSAGGRAVLKIERPSKLRPITASDRKLALAWYLYVHHGSATHAELVRRAHDFRYANREPAFGQLLLSRSGELWVAPFEPWWHASFAWLPPPHPVRWRVYDARGLFISDIVLPARFVPFDVGHDYVAGVSLAAEDIQHVTVWRVRRER